MVKIFDLLALERIEILDTEKKDEALHEICGLMGKSPSIGNPAELEKAIFDRENIISTSIGLGIAIPHVRLTSVSAMTLAIGVSGKGIDYKAFDDIPVRIIIMIAAPEGSHREYLSVLAKIALLLKNESIRTKILEAKTPEDIYSALKGY